MSAVARRFRPQTLRRAARRHSPCPVCARVLTLNTGPPRRTGKEGRDGPPSAWQRLRAELREYRKGWHQLAHNTRLSWRIFAAAPPSPTPGRDELYPAALRHTPTARLHLVQNLRDVAALAPLVGLLIIPGSTVVIPIVVAVAPWLLPSTFPQRQTWRDADVAAVFRQLDVDDTGRSSLHPATPLLAG